jgi:hypothetical protein
VTARNTPYSRRVFTVLFVGGLLASAASYGSWVLQPDPEATPLYLLHLPHCLLLPLALLGLPIRYFSVSASSERVYSRGAAALGASLAGAWSVAALVDPMAVSDLTQWGLIIGWMAGGTTYEVLLLWLLARL